MVRPRNFDNLAITSISIERNTLDRAKEMNINISEICREALAREINDPEIVKQAEKKKSITEKFMNVPSMLRRKLVNFVGEDPRRAERWACILNERCNTTFQPQEIMEYVYYS